MICAKLHMPTSEDGLTLSETLISMAARSDQSEFIVILAVREVIRMKFAAFTTVAGSAGEATDAVGLLENLRAQTIMAEELGFEAMWLGEHHFGPYGVGDIPNPILLGADLAARTSRIRIGQMANIVPWWHPIRLAEDLAILDNMTEGRIEVGFGRGIWPYEGPQFHPNADPRKDKENRELVPGDDRDCAGDMVQRVFFAQWDKLQLSCRRHSVLPPQISVKPRMAGRRQGDEAARDSEAVPKSAPTVVDDGLI